MPNPENEQRVVIIATDPVEGTINIACSDRNQWKNLMTCIMGLGVLYNQCVNEGYPEREVNEAVFSNLLEAIAKYK